MENCVKVLRKRSTLSDVANKNENKAIMNENRGLIDKINELRDENVIKKDRFKAIEQEKGIKIKDILDMQKKEKENQ